MSSDTYHCGHPRTPENSTPVGNGFMRCRECRRRLSAEQHKRRQKVQKDTERFRCGHPYTSENTTANQQCRTCCNEAARKYQRRRYAERRAAGMCARCAEPCTGTYCDKCSERYRKLNVARYRRHKGA